ncbi:MAG: PQQ-binding-like beta-propeller repeat protein [Planctomycetes bacterium]|nr:PQQ-binding-like beta-propeller repeat protein [Planctomycetota bacterium]
MVRCLACGLMALLTFTLGCASGPRANWEWAVTDAALAKADLGYYWQNTIVLGEAEKLQRIWHLDENVYCLSDRNRVYVFNAVTGQQKWSSQLGRPTQTFFAPCHIDRIVVPSVVGVNTAVNPPAEGGTTVEDVVVFNTVTEAMVIQRGTGKLLHRIDFARANFAANTAVASDGKRVFVAGVKGRYFALDLATGLMEWKLSTHAQISSSPVYMGQMLFVASHDGTIYATWVSDDHGRKIWPDPEVPQASAAFAGDIAVDDRGVFAGSRDYSVYAFSPIMGEQMWRFRCGGPITQPVQLGKTNVYARADRDKFYSIDLPSGQRAKWTLPDAIMTLAEIDNNAFILNKRNELMVVDAAIGKVRIIVPLAGLQLFVPNTKTQAIFAANADGLLCRISPRRAGHVTTEMLTDTRKDQPTDVR